MALISAAALAYEILLMRLFSIVLWHHFAYMIISLALLGYGASGALLALARTRRAAALRAALLRSPRRCSGLSAIGCFLLAQRVPFNPLEILWDPRQPAYLLAVYLLLLLPFLCAGACVCMAFSRFRGKVSRIYSFDILGAGAGSLASWRCCSCCRRPSALKLIGALGCAAAAVAWLECGRAPALAGGGAAGPGRPALAVAARPGSRPSCRRTRSCRRPCAFPRPGWWRSASSPLGLVSVVESPRIPLRHAPGLSLNATAEPPPQLGVFTDGEGLNALTRFDGRRESLAHLDQISSALPYHLLRQPRVLVLGAGAGADVLQAHYHGARQIDAVELNPQVVELVRHRFAEYAGGVYGGVDRHRRRVHVAEARGFVAASDAALRPDPGGAARFLQRVVGRPVRAGRELSLHGRGRCRTICGTCSPAACWRSRAGSRCRRAMRSSCSPPRWWRWSARASPIPGRGSRWCAAGRPARCWSRTAPSAARTSRRSRPSASRAPSTWPSIPACSPRRRTASTWSRARPVRRRDGAARSGPGRIHAALQVPHRTGHRRQAALLPLLQVALAAGTAVAEGAGRLAAARMGLSGAGGDAGPGGAREPAADRPARGLGRLGRRRQGDACRSPDRAAACWSTSWRSASASCSSRSRSSRSSCCS